MRDEAPERDGEPEDDPPELVLDPPRGEADPDLPLDDDEGVRDPACGISTTRAGSGAREVDDPSEPEEPDELDPPAGRGIA